MPQLPRLLGPSWPVSLRPTVGSMGTVNDSERRALVFIYAACGNFGNRGKPISSRPLNQFAGNWLYRTFPKSSEKFLSILWPRSLSDIHHDDCEFWKLL